jgi:UDP-N-acetylglucosamine 2-epimerase (non-hydrolysing)
MSLRVLTIIGTRPEAIKMAPVVEALRKKRNIHSGVCVTGQHREMLDQVLSLFQISPQYDLNMMRPGQGLNDIVQAVVGGADRVIDDFKPDRILVQGDTTTAMAAALAAFNRGVPVGHVEAGLRTHDMSRPWPEEMNRRAIDVMSDLLFAPTPAAKRNLQLENLPGRILVTGNTGIDALHACAETLQRSPGLRAEVDATLPPLAPGRRLILVTGHRRETFGEGLRSICAALARLAAGGDVDIVYPVHLNPHVQATVRQALAGCEHVHLIPPLGYLAFVRLMQRADLVITDSGGVQEEAPALGVPVLVTRTETERGDPTVDALLVGADGDAIVAAAQRLIRAAVTPRVTQRVSPYGDGRAATRIVAALLGEAVEEFEPDARLLRSPTSEAPSRRLRVRRAVAR